MRLMSKPRLVVTLSLLLSLAAPPGTAHAFGMSPNAFGSWSMANTYRGSLYPFYGTPFLPSMPQYMTGQMPAYYPLAIWGGMYPGGPTMMGGGGMMGMPMSAGIAF